MDFCRLGSISPAPEAVLSVLPPFFGCLGIQWGNLCFFLQKVAGGALSLGGLLLVTFVNI